MCLQVNVRGGIVRERGVAKAPTRKVAYKLVTSRRRAFFRGGYMPRYTFRSTHFEFEGVILRGRKETLYGQVNYNAGIHVYTTLRAAKKRRAQFGYGLILRVEVNAAHWVASGDRNDALYSKIKVLGRVK